MKVGKCKMPGNHRGCVQSVSIKTQCLPGQRLLLGVLVFVVVYVLATSKVASI